MPEKKFVPLHIASEPVHSTNEQDASQDQLHTRYSRPRSRRTVKSSVGAGLLVLALGSTAMGLYESTTDNSTSTSVLGSMEIPTRTIQPPVESPVKPGTNTPHASVTETSTVRAGDTFWSGVRTQITEETHTAAQDHDVNVVTQIVSGINIRDNTITDPDHIYPNQHIEKLTPQAITEILHFTDDTNQLTTSDDGDAHAAAQRINQHEPATTLQAISDNRADLQTIETAVTKKLQGNGPNEPTYSTIGPSNAEMTSLLQSGAVMQTPRTNTALPIEKRARLAAFLHREPSNDEVTSYGNVVSALNNNAALENLPAGATYNTINDKSLTLLTAFVDADIAAVNAQGLSLAQSTELQDIKQELKGLETNRKDDYDELYTDFTVITDRIPDQKTSSYARQMTTDPIGGANGFLTDIDVIDKLNTVDKNIHKIVIEQEHPKQTNKILNSAATVVLTLVVAGLAIYTSSRDRLAQRFSRKKK